MKGFEGCAFGKWILAGEHTVLRSGKALVFPLKSKSIAFQYLPSSEKFHVEFDGSHGDEVQLLFWGVLERALETVNLNRNDLTGSLRVTSELPIGAGLGASAALCVVLGQWFVAQGWVKEDSLYEFARGLENLFHGESSGVDIAAAMSGAPIEFTMRDLGQSLDVKWRPHWYLSYSGQRGVTKECVAKVKALRARDLQVGEEIDQDMKEAVAMAQTALQMSEVEGPRQLADAITRARSCFERWGLVSGKLQTHLQMLMEKGAWAVKPTGSGDGGYALSLWRHPPPHELLNDLIPV